MVLPGSDTIAAMVRHRRHLHAHPEVGLALPDTHNYVSSELQRLGVNPEVVSGTGVSARIKGTNPRLTPIVFRADMDALPVHEDLDLSFSSTRDGAMHACGHDLHMATLLGVAEDLVRRPPARDVILAFQPGEESDRGALEILNHRELTVSNAETFAVHVNAVLPTGRVAYSKGTFMAFGDWLRLDIEGPGGHASAPERAGNPIQMGARFEEAIVDLATALSTPKGRAVATVTEFLSGNTVNVIPTHGSLRGTVRTVNPEQREILHRGMSTIVDELSSEMGLAATLTITAGYPAVVSDPDFIETFLWLARAEGLGSVLQEMDHPSMVIEDFSYFLQKWPGAMVYVGAAIGEAPSFNHSATAQFDEEAMTTAFRLFRMLAPSEPA